MARNVPLLEPAGIVSEAGTVRLVELELSPTVPPPDPVRITVQVLEALGARAPGLQAMELIELTAVATLTVPPVPVTTIESPVGDAPRLLADRDRRISCCPRGSPIRWRLLHRKW